jgi:hypothetical protein
MGEQYKVEITKEINSAAVDGALNDLITFKATDDGQRTYDTMLTKHNRTFPMHVTLL